MIRHLKGRGIRVMPLEMRPGPWHYAIPWDYGSGPRYYDWISGRYPITEEELKTALSRPGEDRMLYLKAWERVLEKKLYYGVGP